MATDLTARWTAARRGVAVLVASLLLGGLTSYAQGFLPYALNPLANSASGWTLLTALMVWASRLRPPTASVLGGVSFLGLVLGYTVASTLRGFVYDPLLWGAIGIVVGPFVGTAAAWLRASGRRLALGAGLLSGIALGEGVYGLTVVLETTGWFYWTLAILVGAALAAVCGARLRSTREVLVLLGTSAAVAACSYVAYRSL